MCTAGLLGALDAMFPNADANAESLLSAVADVIRRSMGMTDSGGTANAGLSSPETVLLKVCYEGLVKLYVVSHSCVRTKAS